MLKITYSVAANAHGILTKLNKNFPNKKNNFVFTQVYDLILCLEEVHCLNKKKIKKKKKEAGKMFKN